MQAIGIADQPVNLSAAAVQRLILDGIIWPGDCVLVHGPGDSIRWMIERVQRRLLADLMHLRLVSRATRARYRERFRVFAAFTHTRAVLDELQFGEMYRPHARDGRWSDVPAGTILLFRRHVRIDAPDISAEIAEACRADIRARTPYATRELLSYYLWSWGLQKLWLGRRFSRVFQSRKYDVCSGRYIHWLHAADLMLSERPEAWYPARLAIDQQHFRTIAAVRIT